MRLLHNASFGATVLCGRDEGRRTCVNGLPTTPSSVRMLGRFQRLRQLEHESVIQYVDLIRCCFASNSVIIVSEHYSTSLADLIRHDTSMLSDSSIINISLQIADGLTFLHSNEIIVGLLNVNNICVVDNGICNQESPRIRISNYAKCYISDYGNDVTGQVGEYGFAVAPEQLLSSVTKGNKLKFSKKIDVWQTAVIMTQLATGIVFSDIWSVNQYRSILKSSIVKAMEVGSVYNSIFSVFKTTAYEAKDPPPEMVQTLTRCLSILPSGRPRSSEVLESLCSANGRVVPNGDGDSDGFMETIEQMAERIDAEGSEWKLRELRLDDAFFLWRLCGASAESILIKANVLQLPFPVTSEPKLVVEDQRMFGNEMRRLFHVKTDMFTLPLSNLKKKLMALDESLFCHSMELDGLSQDSSGALPVVVKEKDVSYQLSRTLCVRHVCEAVFYHDKLLLESVQNDVPPMVRPEVWAALLQVGWSDYEDFFELDTLAPHTSDRQLDVDIPRCHQYEELMTSPTGHWRLRRLLKMWLLSNPQYVYWQGCDSLAAPFLMLHFNHIPKAAACLESFIAKYLHNFFLKDNSAVIQEYLAVFNHLLSFVDSSLYTCLHDMDFYPELFAIPWFLTCFAHVLPLHKLFHVWDCLLLRNASFPLFIGLAILRQLRPQLIGASFNDAILLFSDLPDLSMEKVIADSIAFYERVPPSCTYRAQSNQTTDSSLPPPRGLSCEMAQMTYIELKSWRCPRLSRAEFVWRVGEQSIVVIDIRPIQEFNRGCVVRSLSYSVPDDSSLLNIRGALEVAQKNCHPICVLGGKDWDAVRKFCSQLISSGTDGVCALDGGFEAIRHDRLLIQVPN